MAPFSKSGLALLLMGAATAASAADIREGQWVLNRSRSILPVRRDQLLSIVRARGTDFVFTIAQSDRNGPVTILGWSGRLDNVARPVWGAPMTMAISSSPTYDLSISGRTADGQAFEEHCRQNAKRDRLRCTGRRSGRPPTQYVEDYDWKAPNAVTFGR